MLPPENNLKIVSIFMLLKIFIVFGTMYQNILNGRVCVFQALL